jgi:hypothetical protein
MPTQNRNCAQPRRNYAFPKVAATWADTRNAHPAVAAAIHALAGPHRPAEAIWANPSPAEAGHVCMAISDYILQGDIEPESDCLYPWGGGSASLIVEWP